MTLSEFCCKPWLVVVVSVKGLGWHKSLHKLMYDVTVSVGSSRLAAVASKAFQSVQSKVASSSGFAISSQT